MQQDQTKTNPSCDAKFTKEQFDAIQNIYDLFNKNLFKGQLGNCLLNFSRESKAMGFYSAKRWTKKDPGAERSLSIDEISLNPDFLHISAKEYCQTLVHEMCHLWQHHFGKDTKGYHNKEFAAKMKEVGLQPSHTGQPGGKETGKKMSDYPIPGGIFEEVFEAIPAEMLLPFVAVPDPEKQKKKRKKNKVKYTCPECGGNVWAKPNMHINCGDCSDGEDNIVQYVPQENEEVDEEALSEQLIGILN